MIAASLAGFPLALAVGLESKRPAWRGIIVFLCLLRGVAWLRTQQPIQIYLSGFNFAVPLGQEFGRN